jgi:hypothetical protein
MVTVGLTDIAGIRGSPAARPAGAPPKTLITGDTPASSCGDSALAANLLIMALHHSRGA